MKNKLAWVCLLVSPLVLGGAAFCLADRDPITQANCDRIKPGMTLKDVETILGREKDGLLDNGSPYWTGSRGEIIIMVNGELDLVHRAIFIKEETEQTLLEKIRNWLGL